MMMSGYTPVMRYVCISTMYDAMLDEGHGLFGILQGYVGLVQVCHVCMHDEVFVMPYDGYALSV